MNFSIHHLCFNKYFVFVCYIFEIEIYLWLIGTTWMQEIIIMVLNKGDPTIARSQPNWLRAPWLEQYFFHQILQASTGPRIITTHLPYHILAPALRDSKAKVNR